MGALNLGRPGLSVLPLGVGDAFSAIHYPTSMLVSRYQNPAWDDDLLLIDCPQSIRKMMREADDGRFHGLDLNRVGTIVLTHLHADHASGLETIAAFFKIAVGRKPTLVGLPAVLDEAPRFLKAVESLGAMKDLFDLRPVSAGGRVQLPFGDRNVRIELRETKHPIPTCAMRISCNGKQLAYSCDTSFDQGLWTWLHEENPGVVIHEVGHGIHTSLDELVEKGLGWPRGRVLDDPEWRRKAIEAKRRAQRLRLTHYPDDLLPLLEADPDLRIMRQGKLEVL